MASSLVFVNQKGDILIYRRYRDDVGYALCLLIFLGGKMSPTFATELQLPRLQRRRPLFVLMGYHLFTQLRMISLCQLPQKAMLMPPCLCNFFIVQSLCARVTSIMNFQKIKSEKILPSSMNCLMRSWTLGIPRFQILTS